MIQDWDVSKLNNKLTSTKNTMQEIQQQLLLTARKQIVDEKHYCESSQYAFYLKEFQKNDVYPSKLDLEILKLKIATETCSLDNAKTKVSTELKDYFDKLFHAVQDGTTTEFERAIDEEIKDLKTIETQQTEELEDKYTILDKISGDSNEKYEPKSLTPIKAVFCSYGHGISMQWTGIVDNGYVAKKSDYTIEEWNKLGEIIKQKGFGYMVANWEQGMITERSLVEFLNSVACEKIRQTVEPKGIKFYSVGDANNPLSLGDKIDLINKISQENGYDATNSIAYELHSNAVNNPAKSGLEVFYSGKKMKNNGLQSRDLALTVLNSISKTHDELNGAYASTYVVKPDHHSRHAYLGFTTLTKSNAVLIEYGFKKNFTDLSIMLSEQEKVGKSIADGLINFLP